MIERRETIKITMSEADAGGRFKASAVLRVMQELAERNAVAMGAGREQLISQGICWVLYRLRFELKREIRLGETVTAVTWPAGIEGLFFKRFFRFEDEEGNLIGEAVTLWVLLEFERRRLLRPTALSMPVGANTERTSALALPGALHMGELAEIETRRVRYTDLDINTHMNNARYADWALDAIAEGGKCPAIRAMQINFIAEARADDRVTLRMRLSDSGAWIEGCRQGEMRPVFEVEALYFVE